MVILWSSYGNPMVWDLYGTEEREGQGAEGYREGERRIRGGKRRGAPKRPSVGSRKDAREMHNAVSGRAAMLLADYSAGSVVAYAVLDDDELAVLDSLEGLDLVSGVVDSGSRRNIAPLVSDSNFIQLQLS